MSKEQPKPPKHIPYPYARFVVHYRDGKTIEENKENPNHWKEIQKGNIGTIAIRPELRTYQDPKTKKHIKVKFPDHSIHSSMRYEYQYIMDKEITYTIKKGGPPAGTAGFIRVGMIIDPLIQSIIDDLRCAQETGIDLRKAITQGHGVFMELRPSGSIRTYIANAYGLGFDDGSLERLYNIKLEPLML